MKDLQDFLKKNPQLNLCLDSRHLNHKSVYFALVGSQNDGHNFIQEARTSKAAALVLQKDKKSTVEPQLKNFSQPVFFVENTQRAWTQAWQNRTSFPDKEIFLVGVTGTNGKTSMTYMLEHILKQAGRKCAVMGTIDHHLQTKTWPTSLTTPGAEVLYPRLRDFIQEGADSCAMEISSHALMQKRGEGLNLDVAIFSNLSKDHLDYHKSMEDYFQAKSLLFQSLLKSSCKNPRVAVLNLMDEWSYQLKVPTEIEQIYGLVEKGKQEHKAREFIKTHRNHQSVSEGQSSIVLLEVLSSDLKGSHFKVEVLNNNDKVEAEIDLRLPVLGRFQIMNWLEAMMGLWLELKKENQLFIKAANSFAGIPGRMQKVLLTKDANVFVDYAHTPDALENSLSSLQALNVEKIHLVFGCGGDRDKEKRPEMARVAQKYSKSIIVTNDNPRTEEPQSIADDILKGFSAYQPEVILDRQKAIHTACQKIKSEKEAVLIAGKGHEDYQIIGDQRKDFSDYEQVLEFYKS